jgi:hypothetical protein
MEDRFWPASDRRDAAGGAPDQELEKLLLSYPGLDGLEPFCVEWELVWPM